MKAKPRLRAEDPSQRSRMHSKTLQVLLSNELPVAHSGGTVIIHPSIHSGGTGKQVGIASKHEQDLEFQKQVETSGAQP